MGEKEGEPAKEGRGAVADGVSRRCGAGQLDAPQRSGQRLTRRQALALVTRENIAPWTRGLWSCISGF